MIRKVSQFLPVFDSRKRRVPGLWLRGERYYGQLWVAGAGGRKTSRRYPLTVDGRPVAGVAEAREALDILRGERRAGALPVPGAGRAPGFASWAAEYLESPFLRQKRPATIRSEREALARWVRHLASVPLDGITPAAVRAFAAARLSGEFDARKRPATPRTVNLDLTALRQCLKAAEAAGRLRALPRIRNLPAPPPAPKRLLSEGDFAALLAGAARACRKNGRIVSQYLRFLAFTGCREREALRIPWRDVDFQRRALLIGGDGGAKNRRGRWLEWSPSLASLLTEMQAETGVVSQWLFPSPKRGKIDRPAKGLRNSLRLAARAAGLEWVGFHHLRHYFASRAVMAGIDFRTVAEWLGHRDGGVLLGRVYAHLSDGHRRAAAEKLAF